jgi:hypothetical protein
MAQTQRRELSAVEGGVIGKTRRGPLFGRRHEGGLYLGSVAGFQDSSPSRCAAEPPDGRAGGLGI